MLIDVKKHQWAYYYAQPSGYSLHFVINELNETYSKVHNINTTLF